MQELSTAYIGYSGNAYIESVYKVWSSGLSKVIQKKLNRVPRHIRLSLGDCGRILVSVLIMNGEMHKAIFCLMDLIVLFPEDTVIRITLLRLAVELGEWTILAHLLNKESKLPPRDEDHVKMVLLFRLAYRIHRHVKDLSFDRIKEQTQPYLQVDKSFTQFELCSLACHIRVMASRLPYADLNKVGDPIFNRHTEWKHLHVLLKSRCFTFFNEQVPCLWTRKVSLPEEFLKMSLTMANFLECQRKMVNELAETAMLKEAQSHVMIYWRNVMRTCIPIHVSRSVNSVLRTVSYSPKLMTNRVLMGQRIVEMFLSDGNKENSSIEATEDINRCSSANLVGEKNSTENIELFGLSAHSEECACMSCTCSKLSPSFLVEISYMKLLYFDLGQIEMKTFCRDWDNLVLELIKRNSDLRQRFSEEVSSDSVYREWRPRICINIARSSPDPYEQAFYVSEAYLCGVRQYMRAHYQRHQETYTHADVDSFKQDVLRLPSDVTVVQLFVDHNQTLWLSRLHNDVEPLTLPIVDLGKSTIIKRLKRLQEKNLASSLATNYKNNILDPKVFWKTRIKLDSSLKAIIREMQEEWFGPVLPLLLPHNKNIPEEYLSALINIGIPEERAKILACASAHAESKERFFELMRMLVPDEEVTINRAAEVYDMMSGEGKKIIKQELREGFTLLNLSPDLSPVPFESMPHFDNAPLISRITSFKIFINQLHDTEIPKPITGRRTFYILNPGEDLTETEDRIGKAVSTLNFKGVRRSIPTAKELATILATQEMFLYVGHGSGGRHFGRQTIRESDCKAVALLMGCDSVATTSEGVNFDGRSAVYDYHLARCPCVVGCLWMVTDGDADRFLLALLDYLFSHLKSDHEELANSIMTKGGYKTFLRGIAMARKFCKLPYLTGSSVVSYGIPVAAKVD
uniref:separase n=1 Tax=Steinernema glaseri TaxID=37863 RepID=A0A1I7ZXK1_9BILA